MKRQWRAIALSLFIGSLLTVVGCGNETLETDHAHAHGQEDEHGHAEEKHEHEEEVDHGHGSHGEEGHAHGENEESGEHADEVTLTPEAIAASGIQTQPVGRRNLTGILVVPARVTFDQESMAHVGTPISGRVAEIRVRLGESVEKGSPILVIDSQEFGEAQSDWLQKRAATDVAKARLEVTQVAYERAKRLFEGKGISESELLRREGDYKSAAADVAAAQSGLLAASDKLRLLGMSEDERQKLSKGGQINPRFTIAAPISGRVIEREATLGEVVGPDSEPLLIVADMRSLWVLADVSESEIHRIPIGAPARVIIPSLKEHVIEGKIAYVDPKINPQTRSAAMRVVVPGGDTPLQPGMFGQAEIEIKAEGSESALVVPSEAVQTVEGGPAVFVPVEGEANTFAKRAITVGPRIGHWIPVLSGLNEGESVVTTGAFILKADLGKAGAAHEH